jgi:hypothetical protein
MKIAKSPKVARKVILNRRISVLDIRERWGNFNEIELASIKGRSDLVRRIQAKYGLDKLAAETNVDVWAKGRQF